MSGPGNQDPNLEKAYSLKSPDENRELYASWAETYEETFVAASGYVYHQHVARLLIEGGQPTGPVLDVGCGTGIVGVELDRLGVTDIDGVDISPEMLGQARAKGIYRDLFTADLTVGMDVADNAYAAIISAGAFTHGHLAAEPIAELVRVARPGSQCVIGINAGHWDARGFARWFDTAVSSAKITPYEIRPVPVYEASDLTDPDQMSNVVLFTVRSPAKR